MAEEKNYFIKVPHALVKVTEEVYLTYYRMHRRSSAQQERDTYNGLISYDALDTAEMLGVESIPDLDAPSVEDMVVDNLLREKLHRCLAQLPKTEQKLLHALYFDGLSERQVANRLGMHRMTVHNRKVKLLLKLKKMMDK